MGRLERVRVTKNEKGKKWPSLLMFAALHLNFFLLFIKFARLFLLQSLVPPDLCSLYMDNWDQTHYKWINHASTNLKQPHQNLPNLTEPLQFYQLDSTSSNLSQHPPIPFSVTIGPTCLVLTSLCHIIPLTLSVPGGLDFF